jgi:hypothetical protein
MSGVLLAVKSPSTTISFEMPQREPGSHSVVWDGRDNAGAVVSSGAYFYQVRSGEFVQAKKMLMLK